MPKLKQKIKKVLQWPGKQIEKEMKMNKAKDDMYREEGEGMMRGYVPKKRSTSTGYMSR